MNNLDYRGTKSATFQLVLLVFLTATLLLVTGYINESNWTVGALGLVSGFVLRDAAAKAAEADRDSPP